MNMRAEPYRGIYIETRVSEEDGRYLASFSIISPSRGQITRFLHQPSESADAAHQSAVRVAQLVADLMLDADHPKAQPGDGGVGVN